MTNKPIEYYNYVIQSQGEGFKSLPNIAGKVASFWVVNKQENIRSIFAFAISLMDFFENEGDTEEKILESAIALIKRYIDEKKITDLEEYAFEYKSHQFIYIDNASWWIKSLKKFFKLKEKDK